MAELRRELESFLECPVCQEIPEKMKIFLCTDGHSICEQCKAKVKQQCPVCRGRYDKPPRRNREREHLIDSKITEHECKNVEQGCQFKATLGAKSDHEKNCGFELVACGIGCEEILQVKWNL